MVIERIAELEDDTQGRQNSTYAATHPPPPSSIVNPPTPVVFEDRGTFGCHGSYISGHCLVREEDWTPLFTSG